MPRNPAKTLTTALFDAVPHACAFIVLGLCLNARHKDERAIYSILTALVAPVATGVWMQLRVGGMMRRLANREWRESLALTFMRPHEFLFPRLLARFAWLLAPLSFVPPALGAILLREALRNPFDWLDDDFFGFLLFAGIFVAEFVAAGAVAVSGALDLLVRLCRARSPGLVTIAVPGLWSAALIAGLIVFIMLCGMLFAFGQWGGVFAALTLAWGFAGAMLFDARRRWGILLTAYGDVETIGAGPEEAIKPAPSSAEETRKIVIGWTVANAISSCAAVIFSYRGIFFLFSSQSIGMSALIGGGFDGVAQWFVLRRRIPRAILWIPLTAAAAFFSAYIRNDILRSVSHESESAFLDALIYMGVGGALSGALAGGAQGFLFPNPFRSALVWALASAVANVIATLLAFGIAPTGPGEFAIPASLLGGAAYGLITARALVWLLKQKASGNSQGLGDGATAP